MDTLTQESRHLYFHEMWINYLNLVRDLLSPKSVIHYQQEFKNFCMWANMKDITHSSQVTTQVAEEFIRYSYSIRRSAPFEVATLRRIWGYTLPNLPNPWQQKLFNLIRINTPHPVNHRPFTNRECRKIFQQTTGEFNQALRFAYWYGMRIGSVCNLKWKDFRGWKRSYRFIHLPPKTARSKPMYLELPILPEIDELLRIRETNQHEFIFPEMHERYVKGLSSICHEFRAVVKNCNIKNSLLGVATIHSFRTTFITHMDEAGAPIYITDSITGHAPRDMHGLYSKPSALAKKRWILRALPPTGSIL